MRQRLTYQNLRSNPYASYLFRERGPGYSGIRLHLKKINEETESPLISEITRKSLTPEEDRAKGPKYPVHFSIEKKFPRIGSGEQKDE